MIDQEKRIRLDKWLWAARFYKTRSLATRAIQGNKVQVNNSRAKPSRIVTLGDILHISKNDISYTITVLGLSEYRRPAPEAQLLYEEFVESIKQREQDRESRKMLRLSRTGPEKKPNKRDRKKIRDFIRKT
jgi:ribosome-associated heat shock protein Hsp15